ncbi:MAG: hypothetical protein WCI67_14745 [Chloroflexales bacterium]
MSTDRNRKALVTLAVGSRYEKMFERYGRDVWRRYCEKFAYDLIVITEPLDNSPRGRERSPAWQKLLILSQEWSGRYERVVWADTDVMINNQHAPDIIDAVPVEKVGAADAYSFPSQAIHAIALQRKYSRWRSLGVSYVDNISPGLYYENRGIPGGELDRLVQTGVFTCSPKNHRELFEHIYYHYEDETKRAEGNYEMPALSYELVKHDLVHWISPQFNLCVGDVIAAFYPFLFYSSARPSIFTRVANKIRRELHLNANDRRSKAQDAALKNIYELGYFTHFAGCPEMMENLYAQLLDNAADPARL